MSLQNSNGEVIPTMEKETTVSENDATNGNLKHSDTNGFSRAMNGQTNADDIMDKIQTVVSLKKQISLTQSVAIIVGIIIGSGIFVSPVGILTNVKSVGMSCVMWTICGVFSGLCALCYAELGACIPQSGGEYIYIKRAFGDFPAFLCLWINFIIICPVGIAASSLIFATYVLKPIFPDCDPPVTALRLLAAVVVTFIVSLNCVNVKWSTKLQVVITTSKLGALIMIIVIGFIYIGKGDVENFKDSFEDSDFSAGSIAIAFYSGFWAFGGWSYLNFLTDELIEPHKNLPRAIVISISIVTVVYLIANIAYFAVLTPSEMLASSAVAVTFSQVTIPAASWITPILIAISVMGSINGNSLSMSRLFMTGAEYKHLPHFISMINIKYLTPAPSLLVIMVLTVIMQSFEEIFYLIELMGFGFSVVLCCVFAGQIYLRYKEPNLHRPIKLPLGLPIFLLLVSIVILVLTVYQKPSESGLGLLLIALGAPLYFVFIFWGNKPKSIQNWIFKLTNLIQKIMYACASDTDKTAL
ncbi:large neutral amino acids transporter small subunit 1-like [Ruditapes philippinarum]|uniref:large neutral amino acids transporter small subunit 1-like n=1 Tax=Ruditapes philippinarum TaxID=129788 RepID=UPI00295A713E|nr:large neutral amino acids transporter small subunit 1-like [Ruditapes philippinarum]